VPVAVFFETGLFVSVVSIRVRNTETNRKIFFWVLRNKPKNNRNRMCFSFFRFNPKIFFVCFEDTLVEPRAVDPHCFDADLEPDPDPAQNLDADPDPDPEPGWGACLCWFLGIH
jgi:hypothetical protein